MLATWHDIDIAEVEDACLTWPTELILDVNTHLADFQALNVCLGSFAI